MNENIRKIEISRDNSWKEITFDKLREGDVFRIFESNGKEVIGNRCQTIFKATSNPYGSDGVWTIDIE